MLFLTILEKTLGEAQDQSHADVRGCWWRGGPPSPHGAHIPSATPRVGTWTQPSFLVFPLREKGECTLAKASRASVVTNLGELCLQKPKKVHQWRSPCGGGVREARPPRPPCPGVGLSYGCPLDMLLPEASPCQAVRWARWYRPGGAVDGLKGLTRVRDPQVLLGPAPDLAPCSRRGKWLGSWPFPPLLFQCTQPTRSHKQHSSLAGVWPYGSRGRRAQAWTRS